MLALVSLNHLNLMDGKKLMPYIAMLLGLTAVLVIAVAFGKRKHVQYDATRSGLYGVTGLFGSGKSYFLTWMASLALGNGRLVFATYEMAGYRTYTEWKKGFDAGELWIGPVLIDTYDAATDTGGWKQIIQVPRDSTVIIDEAQGWWPSHAWKAPPEVTMWLSTIRHRGITVLWATQRVEAVNKWIRDLSFGIWECKHYKAGHVYTLFDPKLINGKPGSRHYDARLVLRRDPKVEAMYDTHNTARHSIEWGGGDDTTSAPGVRPFVPQGPIAPAGVPTEPYVPPKLSAALRTSATVPHTEPAKDDTTTTA